MVRGSSGWKSLVRCPTEVLPLLLPLVGGRKVPAVAQKPPRRYLLLSAEPRRSRGDFTQTEVCSRTELCREPKAIPLADAPIRERNAIEEAECRAEEDIPDLGCREGLGEVMSSTTKESTRRLCLGWWRVKHWTEKWPTRSPYAVGDNRVCLLSCGPLAAKGWIVEGEGPMRPPTARPKKSDAGGLFLHTEPWGVGMTDLSEESVFGGGQICFSSLVSPLSVEKALLIPTWGSGTTPVWSLVGKWSATGSPDCGRGRMCWGVAPTRRLLSR